MKRIKKIAIAFFLVFIAIQFYQPKQNVSSSFDIGKNFANNYKVPPTVLNSLQKACYDCHSNNTNYPWYAGIQPMAWWLNDHIEEGKSELNFSEFGSYKLKRKIKKFNEIAGEVTDGEMPLNSYTWIHKDAILTKEESNKLINWANLMATKLERDSLLVTK